MTTLTPRERREKTAKLLREPEFFEDLLDEVSDGKTLLDFCVEREVIYGRVFRWIQGDDTRADLFATAEETRAKNLEDRVIRGIVSTDDATVKDLLDAEGNPLPVDELSSSAARAVQSIEVMVDKEGGTTKKVKLYDRLKALEMAGRNRKMFTDKTELTGQVSLADLVTASMQKTDGDKAE